MPENPMRKSPPHPPFRRSIILDPVHAADFNGLNLVYACEQCSYFAPESKSCAMGFRTEPHLKANQEALYNRTGRMAICRFQEID